MGRVKIKFPEQKPLFTTTLSVRIGDINYGGHVGNDSVLSIIHEARMRFLAYFGGNELNIMGNSLIMADVMIAYKGEGFYGDKLTIEIFAEEITKVSFDLLYKITTTREGAVKDIAHAKTGMVCFDYTARRTAALTPEFEQMLQGGESA